MILCALVAVSCTDYSADIAQMQKDIDDLGIDIASLETITSNLGELRNLLIVAQSGDPVVSATPIQDGYSFTFKNNGAFPVHNQTSGISAGYADGEFFWTLGGQPLKDASGKNSAISVSPDFRISGGQIEISTDGKYSWKALNPSSGDVITKVEENSALITAILLGNTIVEMPKETNMQVLLSGNGATMATDGTATVDFLLSGKTDSFTVTPLLPEGWSADVIWENSHKGQVKFTAPAAAAGLAARLFFCDGIGNMVASDINFDTLKVDEAFPVMYPAWDAYCAPAAGGQVDVTLYTNLDEYSVSVADGASWLQSLSTKAVREETVSFKAAANDATAMRSALVTIESDGYEQTVVIYQEGVVTPTGANLSENGTANCYIVSAAGDYNFDATVMGNGNEGIIPNVEFHAETAELAPESVVVYYNDPEVINNVTLNKSTGRISFHATGTEGSACISVRNTRSIVIWTWHIWCTDVPKDRTHTNPDQLQFTVMDRNLGATSANAADGETTYGMYYQWGRKDPFTLKAATSDMVTNSSHAFAFAIRYPQRAYAHDGNTYSNWYSGLNDYFWGNPDYGKNRYLNDLKKTIYDPCPVGYMVPPANTFLIFRDKDRAQFTDAGIIVHGDYGQTNFFPWAGRVYKNMNTRGEEVAYWHSSAGRYGVQEDGGGAQTIISNETGEMFWYQGDMRARALPVRCVKQVTE